MKITFVCPPLNLTGGIRVITIYARYLQSFGHDVLLVASPTPATQGLLARILRKLRLPRLTLRPQPPTHADDGGLAVKFLNRPRDVRESDVPDADVIIATWWETAEYVARMSAAKGRKVYFVQGHEVFKGMPVERVIETYRSDMQKITVAQWLVEAIERDGNRQGATVVPNAVDRSQFFAPARDRNPRPRLGTLFSENHNKSFDVALAVIEKIRKEWPDLEIVAFGERAPVEYGDRMADIRLTLHPRQSELREIYSSCDVWLCCSKSEGFNLIAMEAMACRTPVVSTRTGWPTEAVVEGRNGALADVDDVDGLAAGVKRVLQATPLEWQALSAGAAQTVADSGWERSARMFEAALIEHRSPTSS